MTRSLCAGVRRIDVVDSSFSAGLCINIEWCRRARSRRSWTCFNVGYVTNTSNMIGGDSVFDVLVGDVERKVREFLVGEDGFDENRAVGNED